MNEVQFKKGKPTATAGSMDTSISALIVGGVAVAGKLVLGTPYTILRPDDAKALGLDAAYDTANAVVLYHHIDEFYRVNSEGTKLYLMVVDKTLKPADMLTDAGLLYARKLIAFAKGEIRQIAIAINPTFTVENPEVVTDGFNSDIRAAIAPAQEFALWAFETERPVHVLLEGRAYSGNAQSAINLKALTTGSGILLEADKVSLIIAQDYDYAESLAFASGKKYASVGLALGVLSSIQVNQNIGEVETLNLTNAVRNKYVTGGLSSHEKVDTAEAQLATLDQKGYIFPMSYTGISGYRFNNDHVCAPEILDQESGIMNESTIAYGRTMDEAVRRLRRALLPKIKSVQPADKTTGKLAIGVVKSFNSKGNEVFEDMESEKLISGGLTYTNPDSDLLTGDKVLEVAFDLQPTGTINRISGTINLKTTL